MLTLLGHEVIGERVPGIARRRLNACVIFSYSPEQTTHGLGQGRRFVGASV